MLILVKMADTADVLREIKRYPGVRYPVLVANQKGLDAFFAAHSGSPPVTDGISIVTAATDAFARASLNTTMAESLGQLQPVARAALDRGLRVRGYVSAVIDCPYSGRVEYKRVRDIAKALIDIGCYEVSLCETVGLALPAQVAEMLEEVKKSVDVGQLAVRLPYHYFSCNLRLIDDAQGHVRTTPLHRSALL